MLVFSKEKNLKIAIISGSNRRNSQSIRISNILFQKLRFLNINVSLVKEQVELGVAVRMACLKLYCKY